MVSRKTFHPSSSFSSQTVGGGDYTKEASAVEASYMGQTLCQKSYVNGVCHQILNPGMLRKAQKCTHIGMIKCMHFEAEPQTFA